MGTPRNTAGIRAVAAHLTAHAALARRIHTPEPAGTDKSAQPCAACPLSTATPVFAQRGRAKLPVFYSIASGRECLAREQALPIRLSPSPMPVVRSGRVLSAVPSCHCRSRQTSECLGNLRRMWMHTRDVQASPQDSCRCQNSPALSHPLPSPEGRGWLAVVVLVILVTCIAHFPIRTWAQFQCTPARSSFTVPSMPHATRDAPSAHCLPSSSAFPPASLCAACVHLGRPARRRIQ